MHQTESKLTNSFNATFFARKPKFCFDVKGSGCGVKAVVNHLVGLVVKASASSAEEPRFESRLRLNFFSRSSHTNDLKTGTPVDTLPGTWCYRVSTETGWTSVSILWLGEMESLICNFYSVWQHIKLSEQTRPWGTLACCWDIKQPTNKQTVVVSILLMCNFSVYVLIVFLVKLLVYKSTVLYFRKELFAPQIDFGEKSHGDNCMRNINGIAQRLTPNTPMVQRGNELWQGWNCFYLHPTNHYLIKASLHLTCRL